LHVAPASETHDDVLMPTDAPTDLTYRRVLLKLSGEALLGTDRDFGIDEEVLRT